MTDSQHIEHQNSVNSTGQMFITVTRFLQAMRYRWQWIAIIFFGCFASGGFYYVSTACIYQANAELLVDESQLKSTNAGVEASNQRAKLPTYERLITCDTVLKSVLEQVTKDSPEVLSELQTVAPERRLATIRAATSARAARNTNIIELVYSAKSPDSAEVMLSAIVENFLEFIRKHHQDGSVDALNVLNAERHQVDDLLLKSQAKLVRLRTEVGAVSFDEKLTESHPNVQRAVKLNENLTDVRKQRVELQSQLVVLKAAIAEKKDLREHLHALDPIAAQQLIASALGVNPQTAARLGDLEKEIFQDRAKLATLTQHYGPTHPIITELQSKLLNAQAFLDQFHVLSENRRSGLENERLGPMLESVFTERLARQVAHEKALTVEYGLAEKAVLAMNSSLSELMLVQRNVERLNTSYDTLMDKIREIDLGHSEADVRVSGVSEPKANPWPVSPRLKVVVVGCFALSVLISCGVIYLMDTLDDRFRSPEELERQALTTVIGVVRKLEAYEGKGIETLQMYRNPQAANSEAFRTLRTALTLTDPDRQCIAITSAEPGDGKTTITSNLAASMAQSGRRTLLIDADLRKPGLTKLFDLRHHQGLTNLLREANFTTTIENHLFKTGIPNLDLIPCGPKPVDPAEILGSSQFAELLSWGTANYDQVLVDCPPMLVANDAAIVSRITEGLLLIVQPQKNSRRLVLRAVDRIKSVGSNLLGVVVNFAADGAGNSYYGYSDQHGYGYGYGYGADSDHPKISEPQSGAIETPMSPEFSQEFSSEDAVVLTPFSLVPAAKSNIEAGTRVQPRRAA